jgi:Family of unknown function (DUF5670)
MHYSTSVATACLQTHAGFREASVDAAGRGEGHAVHHRRDSVDPMAARLCERGYTIGAFIHVLLVIALVLLLVQFVSGRRVV